HTRFDCDWSSDVCSSDLGARVIYPAEALEPLESPDAAIRHALLHPESSEPLPALLRPGMRLTIAFDDVSLPLPPMRRPDVRQREIGRASCRGRVSVAGGV